MSTNTTTLAQLAPGFTGRLLQPDRRRVRRSATRAQRADRQAPGVIARCHGTADVADAVKLARSLNLEIAVRGGGHNVGGRATIEAA